MWQLTAPMGEGRDSRISKKGYMAPLAIPYPNRPAVIVSIEKTYYYGSYLKLLLQSIGDMPPFRLFFAYPNTRILLCYYRVPPG